MKIAIFLACVSWPMLVFAQASGQCWQDTQITDCGFDFCPAPTMSLSSVVLRQADSSLACASELPCSMTPVDGVSTVCSGGFLSVGTVQSQNIVCGANELAYFNGLSELKCGAAETVALAAAPAAPTAGLISCWADNSARDWNCLNEFGVQTHGIQNQTCASGTYIDAITTGGGTICGGVSFSQVTGTLSLSQEPTLAAHTILANGTGLAAQAAQTSIGSTMAFDGTAQLQCVGQRDGGGVNHVTTGTWPVNSFVTTDASGNEAAVSGGDTAIVSGATQTTGIHDGAGTDFTTTGQTWAPGGLLTALAGNHIGTNTVAAISSSIELSKLAYFVAGGIPASATWIATSSSNFVSTSSIEYPNDFLAGHVFAQANYYASVGTGTLNCEVTRNGTGIAGTVLTFTLGAFGVHTSPVTATGSASANDTYGVICQASSGAGATVNFTFKAVLTP